MKACIDCKHYQSKLGEFIEGKFEIIRDCSIGNDSEMVKWWINNKHKIRGKDNFDEMPCHDDHDSTKILDDVLKKTDELLELLKKENTK